MKSVRVLRDALSDPEIVGPAAIFALCIALLCGVWVVQSHFEAATFERMTGKNVTTWDAMWTELRVQETIK